MNNAAILPYICMHALQIQNVKRNTVKKVSVNELNSFTPVKVVEEKKEDLVPETTINNDASTSIDNLTPEPVENNNS